jgi:hypothetical protein
MKKNIFTIFIIFFISLTYSGCLLKMDDGYRVSDLLHPNTTRAILDYNKIVYRDSFNKNDINRFTGEYKVVESWSNSLYKISKVVLNNSNDKLTLFLYRNDWTNPSYKIEFSSCTPIEKGVGKYIKNIKSGISCYNRSSGEYSNFQVFETTDNTSVLARSEIMLSGLFTDGKEVKISTKYGMSVKVRLDVAGPVLALEKIYQ